ncbi:transcription factor E4F1 isoform X3 [Pseudophryne corroboree]|uniref:transcription factor E4F1 isoform X3 n=1 Tax=Pseudophryne corroboree TaxID=495146 RepID=UPI0030817EE3
MLPSQDMAAARHNVPPSIASPFAFPSSALSCYDDTVVKPPFCLVLQPPCAARSLRQRRRSPGTGMSSEPEPGVEGEEEAAVVAAAAAPSALISLGLPVAPLITHYNEEDDDDVHKCGRCQTEYTSLEEFVQHKIQKACQRALEHTTESTISILSSQEQVVPSVEDPVNVSHVIVEASSVPEDTSNAPDLAVSEELKDMLANEDSMVGDQRSEIQEFEVEWQESPVDLAPNEEVALVKVVVDDKVRYICQLCEKTFKTSNILKAHMLTHSNKKDYECKLCGNAFRTKGSLIRHNRRHTDERPYVCSKCGKSFRESGALSRHMRSLTPCTEKISLNMGKGIVINRDENSSDLVSTDTSSQLDDVDGTPVIRLVTDDQGNLLHEVHVQTDGILGNGTENLKCPQCGDICKSSNSLKVHLKGHEGCKLYCCDQCGREFLKAHLLRKHQESHGNIRKYKCGECGKLYKTVAHVKGHMRVHSDDRPYPCTKCGKRYKTKNAQQVHFRTHLAEKPFVCQFCPHSFREKGSLVRHIRHHTGEKPFVCQKCGRGFAEHGTLNRHLKTKGGCMGPQQTVGQIMSENSNSSEAMSTTLITEEPHTVLVEFSSVVADTQEYIIEDATEDLETNEAAELLQSTGTHEVDNHILKVVQQIVSAASPGQQIIVQNVTLDDSIEPCIEEVPTTDTITIATPESLTEQVTMTLASAIRDGTVLTKRTSTEEEELVPEDVEMEEQVGEFVITSHDGEVEVQTVIV